MNTERITLTATIDEIDFIRLMIWSYTKWHHITRLEIIEENQGYVLAILDRGNVEYLDGEVAMQLTALR